MSTTDGQGRRVIAGRYVLRGLLGQGGMADVELAYDEVLDREVAVKMLHERYASDDSFIERFRREAQSAAALNHPNVVGVYDTGADGTRPYIVMEYISGRSLRDVMRSDGIVPRRAAEIAAEAAKALHFAHERGIVHRDIKPANIMIGDDGRVKVTDFGIARAVNVESVTQTAAVFGTAAYVAPEQAQGQQVDGRTDLYALGCVLFEMITGQQPFLADTAVALAYKHVSEAPPAPRSLNPEIPPSLEAVVLKALAKEPAQRYQTGKEMADDLARAIAGQQTAAAAGAAAGAGAAYAATQAIPRQAAQPDPTLVGAPIPQQPAPGAPDVAEEYYARSGPDFGRIAAYTFMVVLIGVLVGVAYYLFSDLSGQEETLTEVAVPDVVNQDYAVAEQALLAVGLQPQAVPEETLDFPSGTVLRTDPIAGTEVTSGTTILVYVAAEPGEVPIPSLVGMTLSEAEAALLEAGLVVGEVTTQAADDEDDDRVLRQTPAANVPQPLGTPVDLTVGRARITFRMPDVVNLSFEDAQEVILNNCPADTEEDGPCVRIRREPDPTRAGESDVVLESDPESGNEVTEGQDILLVVPGAVATPTPTPTPSPTPTPTPTPRPTATQAPTPTQQPQPTAQPTPTPQPQPTQQPTAQPQPQPTIPPQDPTPAATVQPPQGGG